MFFQGYQVTIDTGSAFWVVIAYMFLFFVGGFLGWVTEVLFRRFVSMKRWINPGFLKGPCLPLYGFGICALHTISTLCIRFMLSPSDPMVTNAFYKVFEFSSQGESIVCEPLGMLPFWAVSIICILLVGIVMTIIEFIAGLIFIKGFHVRLWDYTKLKGNVLGIICPLFSGIWVAVGAVYWFALRPLVDRLIAAMIPYVWVITFIMGCLFALFVLDLISSIKLTLGIRNEAKLYKQIVNFEQFKLAFKEKHIKNSKMEAFRESIKESFSPLTDRLSKIVYKVKASIYIDNKIPEKTNESETPRTMSK